MLTKSYLLSTDEPFHKALQDAIDQVSENGRSANISSMRATDAGVHFVRQMEQLELIVRMCLEIGVFPEQDEDKWTSFHYAVDRLKSFLRLSDSALLTWDRINMYVQVLRVLIPQDHMHSIIGLHIVGEGV